MAEQTIKYDIGLGSVAKDRYGNLVTDSAGNLAVPIEPIYVTIDAEANHAACICARVHIGEDVFVHGSSQCSEQTAGTLWMLLDGSNTHTTYLGSKLRGGRLIETDGVLTIPIYAGVDINRKHESEFESTGVTLRIQWKDISIQSTTRYACHRGTRTFFLGTVMIDTVNHTLIYSDDGVTLPTYRVTCDKDSDPDPEEVEVKCDARFCDPSGASHLRYTAYTPAPATLYLWSKPTTKVEYFREEGEDSESAIRDAIAALELPLITSKAELLYIVTEFDAKRFWRDEENDVPDPNGNYHELTVYRCECDENSSDILWVEKRPADANVTGGVYSKAWTGEGDPEDKRDYLADDKVVAADAEWVTKEGSAYIAKILIEIDPENMIAKEYICKLSGTKLVKFSCGTQGELTYCQPKFYAKPDDPDEYFSGMTIYGSPEVGDYATVDDYFSYWGGSLIFPRAYCENGVLTFDDKTYPSTTDGSIKMVKGDRGFYHNDKFYILSSPEAYGKVYTPVASYYAWTQSPCHGDETVYTEYGYGGAGNMYGSVVDGSFTPNGAIADSGSAIYSVTDDSGIVRYWDADLVIDEEDEEFE